LYGLSLHIFYIIPYYFGIALPNIFQPVVEFFMDEGNRYALASCYYMLFLTNLSMLSIGRHIEYLIRKQVYYFSLAKLGFLPLSYVIPSALIIGSQHKLLEFYYFVSRTLAYLPLVCILLSGTFEFYLAIYDFMFSEPGKELSPKFFSEPGQKQPALPRPQVIEELKEVLSTKPEDDSLTKKEEDLFIKCFCFTLAVTVCVITIIFISD
jgi:hypothetical protein